MINLKRVCPLLLLTLAATLLLANGCGLNPHPEPPFAEPTGPVTGSAGGAENGEVPATGDGDVAVDNAAGEGPALPPAFRGDAATPSDASATADAGAAP